ncbi:hypothetical protein HQ524_00360 [Candidatus Uhrbacteria bacterium]|nr:hypothetical protein [Candidatus Uhrbacteria bacterium]
MKKHIVIFSHGFGVKKDDRGLFTGIANGLSEIEPILFDYNVVDEHSDNMTVRPFSRQMEILNRVINEQRDTHPDAIIDLVCHSQGCRIASLARPVGIRKTIFLAPPTDSGIARTLERYRNNPKAIINLEGVSQLPRSDGSTTSVPAEYWRERMAEGSPLESYNQFANKTDLTVIKALQDTVLGETSFKGLDPKANVVELKGDHDFTGLARNVMVEKVLEILGEG